MTTSSQIACEQCGRRIAPGEGGLCAACGRLLCLTHLHGGSGRTVRHGYGVDAICVECRGAGREPEPSAWDGEIDR